MSQTIEAVDVSQAVTRPLGEPLAKAEPVVEQPALTMCEQAYWDQDDEEIGAAYDALLVDGSPDMISGEHFTRFVELTYHIAVQNRLRQKEMALKIGELMTTVEALSAPKPARKRAPKPAQPAVEAEPAPELVET